MQGLWAYLASIVSQNFFFFYLVKKKKKRTSQYAVQHKACQPPELTQRCFYPWQGSAVIASFFFLSEQADYVTPYGRIKARENVVDAGS